MTEFFVESCGKESSKFENCSFLQSFFWYCQLDGKRMPILRSANLTLLDDGFKPEKSFETKLYSLLSSTE